MKTKTYPFLKGRALRRFSTLPLTLFFCTLAAPPLFAEVGGFDTTLSNYIAKMVLSLLLLLLLGFLAIKFLPGRFRVGAQGKLKLVGTLALGRDAVYIVQTGPEIVALFVSRTSSTVMGRWTLEEWRDFESTLPREDDDNPNLRGSPR